MKLLLQRYDKSDGYATLGRLIINQDKTQRIPHTQYVTLEDTQRDEKIAGETRIPAGEYEIKLRDEGAMTQKYERRFPDMHVGMLWLQGVPGFSWVYCHIGNDHRDTAGCILLGMSAGIRMSMSHVENILYESTKAYVQIYKRVSRAILAGERVFIEVRDEKVIRETTPIVMMEMQFTSGLPKHEYTRDGCDYNSIPILNNAWSAQPSDTWCRLLVVDGSAGIHVVGRVLRELNRMKVKLRHKS